MATPAPARAEWQPQHLKVIWRPLPGSQQAFLTCPAWELLYHGTRGPGKTDALLMDYAQHVGQGFGPWWRGAIFRRKEKDLADLIAKSKRWFWRIFPRAKYLVADRTWRWPTGEELVLANADGPDDYWTWHGQEYPFMGWEELTSWPNLELYELMKSICRSSRQGMPRKYRATANPWGPGHHAVKEYFIDAGAERAPIDGPEGVRMHIAGRVEENTHLLAADPAYIRRLDAIRNPELRKAWRQGDWTVNPGGFLVGVFDRAKHVVKPFPIPITWPRWRALDWGFARPFSVGWYTKNPDTGAIYRYRELYGWKKRADVGARMSYTRVAELIARAEKREKKAGCKFLACPADTGIWGEIGISKAGQQITGASQMAEQGVHWVQARKGPGSRVNGAQIVVDMLTLDRFFVFDTCRHWIRTVPALQPDPDDWEDVDTEQEDHAWDETRYSLVEHHPELPDDPGEKKPAPGTFDHLVAENEEHDTPPRRRWAAARHRGAAA